MGRFSGREDLGKVICALCSQSSGAAQAGSLPGNRATALRAPRTTTAIPAVLKRVSSRLQPGRRHQARSERDFAQTIALAHQATWRSRTDSADSPTSSR